MISLDVKPKTSASPLSLSSKEEMPTLSFSELLKGVSLKQDTKLIQNGALVLSLNESSKDVQTDKKLSKSDILLSLLKGDIPKEKDVSKLKTELPLELNPKITESLSVDELKTLIKDAKQYLKNKIIQSDGFKHAEIQALPQTLKGLAQVAKKFGIELSKITIEEVKSTVKEEVKPDTKQILKIDKLPEIDTHKPIVKTKTTLVKEKAQIQETKTELQETLHTQNKQKYVEQKIEAIKTTPLFKAQTQTEHTTQQLVQTKILSTEKKEPKVKADEMLKSLLNADKALKQDTTLTSDFSVASAKVIAPKATRENSNAFESLLKGDSTDASNVSKLDGLTTSKADSFEVKLVEAKQLTKYLSQDIKTAIEDYKSPFTRIKVQLNPQRLGEIDLTIVQRGKNLHINLSSNSVAINTLAMNAQDLKTQLANNGISNASLNFNNSSQSDQSGANQQQQHQQKHQDQKAQDEYNYFETQEKNEEILSSLEIVVPHYA